MTQLPLAQVADILSERGWMVVLVAGLSMPLIGFAASSILGGVHRLKGKVVTVFYAVMLPLGFLNFSGQSESAAIACPFLILLPVGVLLGMLLLVPHRQAG
jgi:hypothetical protein